MEGPCADLTSKVSLGFSWRRKLIFGATLFDKKVDVFADTFRLIASWSRPWRDLAPKRPLGHIFLDFGPILAPFSMDFMIDV